MPPATAGIADAIKRLRSTPHGQLRRVVTQFTPYRLLGALAIACALTQAAVGVVPALVVRELSRLVEALASAGSEVRANLDQPEGTGYYEAKNRGFDATTADVVAFGDGDCWPDPAWLETLLAPFAVLIGPDGKIIGKSLRGEELENAVAIALTK